MCFFSIRSSFDSCFHQRDVNHFFSHNSTWIVGMHIMSIIWRHRKIIWRHRIEDNAFWTTYYSWFSANVRKKISWISWENWEPCYYIVHGTCLPILFWRPWILSMLHAFFKILIMFSGYLNNVKKLLRNTLGN